MLRYSAEPYTFSWTLHEQPFEREQRRHAAAAETIGQLDQGCNTGVLTVSPDRVSPPLLAVIVHDRPWYDGHEINLGVLLVPETGVLFVGAAKEVLAYNLRTVHRLWRAEADTGFWGLARHGDTIIMQAELAMIAWDLQGVKQWQTFVEPPYDYSVQDDTVHLICMGTPVTFPLATGPDWGGRLPWSTV